MKLVSVVACALLALWCSLAVAQQPPGPDPLGENLFPPELVMQHQQAIGLNDSQKQALRAEVRQAQARMTELQWQLTDEVDKLVALVKPDNVDEQRAIAQLDRVLNVERDIKRAQLTLVTRIKNQLSREQQARLRELRGAGR